MRPSALVGSFPLVPPSSPQRRKGPPAPAPDGSDGGDDELALPTEELLRLDDGTLLPEELTELRTLLQLQASFVGRGGEAEEEEVVVRTTLIAAGLVPALSTFVLAEDLVRIVDIAPKGTFLVLGANDIDVTCKNFNATPLAGLMKTDAVQKAFGNGLRDMFGQMNEMLDGADRKSVV